MKKILILVATIFIASCSDNLENLNKNIKDPAAVSGESLFSGAQKAFSCIPGFKTGQGCCTEKNGFRGDLQKIP